MKGEFFIIILINKGIERDIKVSIKRIILKSVDHKHTESMTWRMLRANSRTCCLTGGVAAFDASVGDVSSGQ